MVILDVLFRWLHVIAACLAIGGAFFLRVILPIGINQLDAEHREGVFLRCRRAFKLVVHPCILVFLVTGAYNAWKNWPKYQLSKELGIVPITHGFFGTHILLGLAVIGISLWLLAGREPVRNHRGWMRVNLVLMFLAVVAASSLKWVRDDMTWSKATPHMPAGRIGSATQPAADPAADPSMPTAPPATNPAAAAGAASVNP